VSINALTPIPRLLVARCRRTVASLQRCLSALPLVVSIGVGATSIVHADALTRGNAAYSRGDYIRAVHELSPLAQRGNARALGLLGFLYENGFGVPQAYDTAVDFYAQGAAQGDPFAQAMLGLMYDKGHGVPLDFTLAYKWLDLATARAHGLERDTYARFRDAIASKLSTDEVIEGQRLVRGWIPVGYEPSLRAERGSWESRHHHD
jgi:hypothetical protein